MPRAPVCPFSGHRFGGVRRSRELWSGVLLSFRLPPFGAAYAAVVQMA